MKDADKIYPDPDDGAQCQTPLGSFWGHAEIEDNSVLIVVHALGDSGIFYHEDAGERNEYTVFPTFDLRALLDVAIADHTNGFGEIDADACAVLEALCSEVLSKLHSLPRNNRPGGTK